MAIKKRKERKIIESCLTAESKNQLLVQNEFCLLPGMVFFYWQRIFFFLVVLKGPPCDVVKLRTSTPLFRAYEEVYNNLESKMCPSFHKSKEVRKLQSLKSLNIF